MKTYFIYGIIIIGGKIEVVEAHKVTSSQHTLTFFTRDGLKKYDWEDIMGFIEDDHEPRGDLMEEIFEKPSKYTTRQRYGRLRFNTMTKPTRFAGEGWYGKLPPIRLDGQQLRLLIND